MSQMFGRRTEQQHLLDMAGTFYNELTVAALGHCFVSYMRKELMRLYPSLRNYGQVMSAGGGGSLIFFSDVATDRLPIYQ